MKRAIALSMATLLACALPVSAADDMKAFPPAEEGMVRHVLQLPEKNDESLFQVELIAGQTVKLDKENRYFFGGEFEEETIGGWGYPRYLISELGPMAGTRMAIDPAAPKIDRFVTLGGEPYLIRYNSRLPIVVYAPKGVDLRYRVWRAGAKMFPINEG
ncbi:ecotin [Dokdonella sp.]|uniref:ecotin n=1 Tax=Dokdonella sp. TaxID=2291710 RepID=UPI003C3607EE